MTHREEGLLASYNSLLDEHLVGYFANQTRRRHLRKAGLITKNGVIVDNATYRLQMAKKDQKKYVRNQLAAEIVNKALDMERMRRFQIEKELEQKYKVQLVKEFKNHGYHAHPKNGILLLPPAKSNNNSSPADGNILPQLKPRIKSAPMPPKASSTSSHSSRAQAMRRHRRRVKSAHNQAVAYKIQLQSLAEVTIKYVGSTVYKSSSRRGFRMAQGQEIMVIQQHCGGNTLCVFKEILTTNTIFTFISRRHRGLPFGLAFYVDGILDCRLSCCCEYRYKPGHILGGKSGHFMYVSVVGAAPCYKCQAASAVANGNAKVLQSSETEENVSESDEEEAQKSFDIIVTVSSPTKDPAEKQDELPRRDNESEHSGQSESDKSKTDTDRNQDDYSIEEFEDDDRSNSSSDDSSDSSSTVSEVNEDVENHSEAQSEHNSDAETYSIQEDMSVASIRSSNESRTLSSPAPEECLNNIEAANQISEDSSISSHAEQKISDRYPDGQVAQTSTTYVDEKPPMPQRSISSSSSSSSSSSTSSESSTLVKSDPQTSEQEINAAITTKDYQDGTVQCQRKNQPIITIPQQMETMNKNI